VQAFQATQSVMLPPSGKSSDGRRQPSPIRFR
jgi:hypothetical protein